MTGKKSTADFPGFSRAWHHPAAVPHMTLSPFMALYLCGVVAEAVTRLKTHARCFRFKVRDVNLRPTVSLTPMWKHEKPWFGYRQMKGG